MDLFTLNDMQVLVDGVKALGFSAEINDRNDAIGNCGSISFILGTNGCGMIDKPNGSRKWYYDKSPRQFLAIVKKVIENN